MLGSRWILGGLLGQSDGAEVYEAEEAHQRRFAAIKFFDPRFAAEPAWGEHTALTRALSELPGDGLARAYDIGTEPLYHRPYVASERITFPTLARYVAERGPLTLRAVAHALDTLAGGLDVAHAAGIVHGGLKPQNVFVSFDNARWARITDFAVARLRAANAGSAGMLLGWSAPEAGAGFVTAAGDRYALALLVFFAATGVPWYSALRSRDDAAGGRSAATRRASDRAQSQGGELDPVFDAWFERALAVDPAARFTTAGEMARAFVDVFGGGPTAAVRMRAPVHASPPPAPRHPSTPPSAAPETPMATTVALSRPSDPPSFAPHPSSFPPQPSTPGTHSPSLGPGSYSPDSPKPMTSVVPPGPVRSTPGWLAAAVIAALLALAVGAWWLRTR
jgi:serine/threonine-protein kinase